MLTALEHLRGRDDSPQLVRKSKLGKYLRRLLRQWGESAEEVAEPEPTPSPQLPWLPRPPAAAGSGHRMGTARPLPTRPPPVWLDLCETLYRQCSARAVAAQSAARGRQRSAGQGRDQAKITDLMRAPPAHTPAGKRGFVAVGTCVCVRVCARVCVYACGRAFPPSFCSTRFPSSAEAATNDSVIILSGSTTSGADNVRRTSGSGSDSDSDSDSCCTSGGDGSQGLAAPAPLPRAALRRALPSGVSTVPGVAASAAAAVSTAAPSAAVGVTLPCGAAAVEAAAAAPAAAAVTAETALECAHAAAGSAHRALIAGWRRRRQQQQQQLQHEHRGLPGLPSPDLCGVIGSGTLRGGGTCSGAAVAAVTAAAAVPPGTAATVESPVPPPPPRPRGVPGPPRLAAPVPPRAGEQPGPHRAVSRTAGGTRFGGSHLDGDAGQLPSKKRDHDSSGAWGAHGGMGDGGWGMGDGGWEGEGAHAQQQRASDVPVAACGRGRVSNKAACASSCCFTRCVWCSRVWHALLPNTQATASGGLRQPQRRVRRRGTGACARGVASRGPAEFGDSTDSSVEEVGLHVRPAHVVCACACSVERGPAPGRVQERVRARRMSVTAPPPRCLLAAVAPREPASLTCGVRQRTHPLFRVHVRVHCCVVCACSRGHNTPG